MAHNTSEYNFAYNNGGILKFVWKNMFVSNDNSRISKSSWENQYDSNGWNQGHKQQGQQGYGIGSNAGNNNETMDMNQRGKG